MTMENETNENNQSVTTTEPVQEAPTMDSIRAEQWQQFISNMAAHNTQLAAELQQTRNALTGVAQQQRQEQLKQLTPEQRADQLQAELDNIRNTASAAYQNQVSQDVWRRRDAEAAARLLRLAKIDINHPNLYRGDWNQDWMPRFVASVENIQAERARTPQANTTNNNVANRANVGNGSSTTVPEIDPGADGPTTIRFALQKLYEGRT